MNDHAEEQPRPRTWADFRPQRKQLPQEVLVLRAAARKIFASQEGKVLLEWIRGEVTQPLSTDAPDGALREQNGARTLLAKIEGLIASGGPSKSS